MRRSLSKGLAVTLRRVRMPQPRSQQCRLISVSPKRMNVVIEQTKVEKGGCFRVTLALSP
jgi:hypothetical protein